MPIMLALRRSPVPHEENPGHAQNQSHKFHATVEIEKQHYCTDTAATEYSSRFHQAGNDASCLPAHRQLRARRKPGD